MFKKLAISSAVFAALGLSAGAHAFMIDDFKSGATNQDSTTLIGAPQTFSGQSNNGTMATGYRDIWYAQFKDPDLEGGRVRVNPTGGGGEGVLNFSNGPDVRGNLIVDWDGDDTAPTGQTGVAPAIGPAVRNLGTPATGLDLTDTGTSDAFFFDVDFADLGFDFQISLVDTGGDIALFDFPGETPAIGDDTTFGPILFTWFSNFANVDFKNIRSISLLIQPTGDARDFTIDNFYTGKAPEPATVALFGLGLAGLGAVARRRARKA
jgi:hypothetical protein